MNGPVLNRLIAVSDFIALGVEHPQPTGKLTVYEGADSQCSGQRYPAQVAAAGFRALKKENGKHGHDCRRDRRATDIENT